MAGARSSAPTAGAARPDSSSSTMSSRLLLADPARWTIFSSGVARTTPTRPGDKTRRDGGRQLRPDGVDDGESPVNFRGPSFRWRAALACVNPSPASIRLGRQSAATDRPLRRSAGDGAAGCRDPHRVPRSPRAGRSTTHRPRSSVDAGRDCQWDLLDLLHRRADRGAPRGKGTGLSTPQALPPAHTISGGSSGRGRIRQHRAHTCPAGEACDPGSHRARCPRLRGLCGNDFAGCELRPR